METMACASGSSNFSQLCRGRPMQARSSSIASLGREYCQQHQTINRRVSASVSRLRLADSFPGTRRGLKGGGGRRQATGRGCGKGQVVAEGSALEKVVDVAVKTGKQGIKAATELIPESVPRPVATVGVGVVGLLVFSAVLKAVFNTALTIAVIGGVGYAAFIYVSKEDKDGGGGGGGKASESESEDPLDEARRIMEKYK